jgi:hypothetical protein
VGCGEDVWRRGVQRRRWGAGQDGGASAVREEPRGGDSRKKREKGGKG